MKIRFYVNAQKPRAAELRQQLTTAAGRHGLGVVDGGAADIIIALGGDGTILRAVHEFPGIPVLGFNLGGLGYLSSVGERDFSRALAMLAEGRYRVSERTMLEIVGDRTGAPRMRALNDIVIVREMSGHAAILDLVVDGRTATRYLADGLVMATPTGSTAYSLSAGGPVLLPDSRSFVITPMNPHALGIRPMVVNDGSRFTVTSRARTDGNGGKVGVYADGDPVALLPPDGVVEVAKAAQGAVLVELEGYDPYIVLARKLGWSGSNVGVIGDRPTAGHVSFEVR